jgi:hypothetical protein
MIPVNLDRRFAGVVRSLFYEVLVLPGAHLCTSSSGRHKPRTAALTPHARHGTDAGHVGWPDRSASRCTAATSVSTSSQVL